MEPRSSSGVPRRVLVCEDAEDARFLLGEMLRTHGFDVLEASSGSEAITVAQNTRVDVALIDIGLPDVNGFEVARCLRGHPTTRHLRLIAVTGYGTAEDRETSRLAGFDRHLLKPARIEDVLAAIDG